MSKRTKKNKSTYGSGGGGDAEPLKVNWFVIAGAVLVVGALIFFSIQQTRQADATATAVAQTSTAVVESIAATSTASAQGTATAVVASIGCAPTTKQWATPPEMKIDPGKDYTATVKLKKGGEFKLKLFAAKAPQTVNNFVFLAREGFYNCVTFHRVLEGFMAQGGDPTGTGSGGPGYEFPNEVSDLKFDKAGILAMANAGPDTNGSQFFITFGPTNLSPNDYTVFGEVSEGMEVVNGITRRDPDEAPTFMGDVIESITITEN